MLTFTAGSEFAPHSPVTRVLLIIKRPVDLKFLRSSDFE